MKLFIAIASFFITYTMSSQELAKFKWEKRLVVLVSSNWESETVQKQLELFAAHKKSLEEREMLLIKLSPLSDELEKYSLDKSFKGVLLIGKDGGLKSRYEMVIAPKTIFELVDSMPMRQAEMRNKKY
ncbi:DUF4174 domain-containing protein [Flagellimonas eckloniae]|uniref:DUF4174 domain-containing protein n=1 Tax=Flagellimonas eckloniae TaxID=346185 RepID=A0A0N8WFV0_9FLAO|nr:DUF4174 domain-containing protein [Allomuricauda eckloniae]KQC29715.1 hypothetical protein AAY42_07305 [Allomuricauda eckloniae]